MAAIALHGEMEQERRSAILSGFLAGKYEAIVATGVLARGLDLHNVKQVRRRRKRRRRRQGGREEEAGREGGGGGGGDRERGCIWRDGYLYFCWGRYLYLMLLPLLTTLYIK